MWRRADSPPPSRLTAVRTIARLGLVGAALLSAATLASCSETVPEAPPISVVEEEARASVLPAIEETEWADSIGIEIMPFSWNLDSEGIPDHERQAAYPIGPAGEAPDATNSPVVADPTMAIPFRVTLPLEPELTAEPGATAAGPIGIMITGARIHNPYEDGSTAFAIEQNFSLANSAFLDICNGHPSIDGSYHYHGNPTCLTSELDAPGEHSRLVGFILDGFPIYGPQGEDGLEPADLDECGGHIGPTPENAAATYHYHFSVVPPYGITCYSGRVDPSLIAGQGADRFGDELCVLNPEAPDC